MLAAARAINDVLGSIRAAGSPLPVMADRLVTFERFTDFIGMPEIRDLERRFADVR